MAVAAHELVHKHGKAVLGEAGWKQLHEVIDTWANRPEGSLERRVYDEATARVQGSRPTGADEASYSSEELFPYAVQVAMELGVEPTALMPANSVQGWLAQVRASLQALLGKLTGNPQAFDGQDLVDLAFGIAQRERSTRDDTSGAATDLVHGTAQRTALLFSRTRVPKVREALTFSEAREAVKQFQGKELTNESTGLKAVVSRNSLDKMLSGKAVAKSETPATHAMAVANADSLFEHAILGWSKQDRSDDVNIRAVHRFFAHMQVNGRSKLVKLTVKEMASLGFSNPLYTIAAVELNERVPSAQWLEAAAREDGLELNTKDPQRGEWVVEIANSQGLALKQTLYGVQLPARAVNHSAGDLFSLAQEIERRNARGDAAGDNAPRFSTRSDTPAQSLSLEQVQQLVQQALSGLRNPPPVDIVGRSEEAWVGAPEGVMGAALPEEGRIVIVASAHQNADAVAETLFHEMFHLGVRKVLPSRDYVQSMLDLAKRDRRVQQYAIEWKAKASDAPHQLHVLRERGFAGTELTAQYEALAIEEGLAVVAEELRAQKLAGTRLGMRIRTLANWLASVADRMGMGRLAASIRAMSYNEAERFVMRAIDHAGAVGTETSHSGQTRFSTRSAQDPSASIQTGDTNDGTQPLHPMRVEMQRDGTLMVKGDPVQLQERLRQGGVDRVLRRKGGVLVGLDQVRKARQLLQQSSPRAQVSAGATLPSQSSLPDQQFSRSAPDQNPKAKDLLSQPPSATSLATLANSAGANFERIITQVPGLVVLHADALHPDSLGSTLDSVAATFSGGRYATMDLLEDLVLYRAWTPGQSREFGGFWSLDKPAGSLQTRIDSALLPEWGVLRGTGFRSQATDFTTIKVPAGTRVHAGEVGSQGGQWVGGGSQILIEGGPQEVWKIDGGKLR